ncbi:hypothetical protein F3Y22_tig00110783pilonHSYRG00161 [Hibiscus syriacus]|uniref:Uncharacterized protein n=1 Tax=Hibiscus syriacus TaxID=106335 RepID=A0A6A2ZTB2_HIBSY|nr:hypothetical protein F3Y22_tig00110783pilonHSYRG00161 [Hibiscus syriacus]
MNLSPFSLALKSSKRCNTRFKLIECFLQLCLAGWPSLPKSNRLNKAFTFSFEKGARLPGWVSTFDPLYITHGHRKFRV